MLFRIFSTNRVLTVKKERTVLVRSIEDKVQW